MSLRCVPLSYESTDFCVCAKRQPWADCVAASSYWSVLVAGAWAFAFAARGPAPLYSIAVVWLVSLALGVLIFRRYVRIDLSRDLMILVCGFLLGLVILIVVTMSWPQSVGLWAS